MLISDHWRFADRGEDHRDADRDGHREVDPERIREWSAAWERAIAYQEQRRCERGEEFPAG